MLESVAFTALGALVGTLFWLYFLVKYFPSRLTEAQEKIERHIIERTPEIVEASTPHIVKAVQAASPDLDAKIGEIEERFKAHIPDIDAKIEEIKESFSPQEFLEPMIAELEKPPQEWDPRYFTIMTNIANTVVSNLVWMIDNDENFNKWFYDKLRGLTMNMKNQMTKELMEAGPEIAKAVGIDPAILEGGLNLDMIPEEYRWMVQLFMLYQKGGLGNILGGGGGKGAYLPEYYGGY